MRGAGGADTEHPINPDTAAPPAEDAVVQTRLNTAPNIALSHLYIARALLIHYFWPTQYPNSERNFLSKKVQFHSISS